MKIKLLSTLFLFCVFTLSLTAQVYPALNMSLLSKLSPETDNTGADGRKYSGCWGWYQASKNKEYAIVGSSSKTYFIDVTNPLMPVIVDSVKAKRNGCTWRELKNYQQYLYVVSDDSPPNSFQIINMQYLPDSVHVEYDGTSYFERGHTCWVDGNKLYVGGQTSASASLSNMCVYSLATPTAPVLLRTLSQDFPSINYVHDMFVRNDTVYASAGNQGLHVFRYNSTLNVFTALGSLTGYTEAGYNHASSITQNGNSLVFCDEVPTGISMKIANVTNLGSISLSSLFKPNTNPEFCGHNPYVLGNNFAFVSCYQDGLMLYNISNPNLPVLAGFFDTYPQGGANVSNNYFGNSYRGNWGAYPYLPSGVIVACDMQNGVFLLQANGLLGNATGIKERNNILDASVYPNPAKNNLNISLINPDAKEYSISVTNILGQVVYNEENLNDCSFPVTFKTIDVSNLESGTYLISIKANEKQFQKKIIITK